jgi:hypothetical protein
MDATAERGRSPLDGAAMCDQRAFDDDSLLGVGSAAAVHAAESDAQPP